MDLTKNKMNAYKIISSPVDFLLCFCKTLYDNDCHKKSIEVMQTIQESKTSFHNLTIWFFIQMVKIELKFQAAKKDSLKGNNKFW